MDRKAKSKKIGGARDQLKLENLKAVYEAVDKGMAKALEINQLCGGGGVTEPQNKKYYGTVFTDSGVRVDDKTVFCHDAYNKNRWICPMQTSSNLMLKLYSAVDIIVQGVDSPSFLGMMLVHQRSELMKANCLQVFSSLASSLSPPPAIFNGVAIAHKASYGVMLKTVDNTEGTLSDQEEAKED